MALGQLSTGRKRNRNSGMSTALQEALVKAQQLDAQVFANTGRHMTPEQTQAVIAGALKEARAADVQNRANELDAKRADKQLAMQEKQAKNSDTAAMVKGAFDIGKTAYSLYDQNFGQGAKDAAMVNQQRQAYTDYLKGNTPGKMALNETVPLQHQVTPEVVVGADETGLKTSKQRPVDADNFSEDNINKGGSVYIDPTKINDFSRTIGGGFNRGMGNVSTITGSNPTPYQNTINTGGHSAPFSGRNSQPQMQYNALGDPIGYAPTTPMPQSAPSSGLGNIQGAAQTSGGGLNTAAGVSAVGSGLGAINSFQNKDYVGGAVNTANTVNSGVQALGYKGVNTGSYAPVIAGAIGGYNAAMQPNEQYQRSTIGKGFETGLGLPTDRTQSGYNGTQFAMGTQQGAGLDYTKMQATDQYVAQKNYDEAGKSYYEYLNSPSPADSYTIKGGRQVSGTVICTALHSQGLISDALYQADYQFGLKQDEAVLRGYRMIFTPLADKMKKSKKLAKFVKLFALPVIKEMAHQVNPEFKGSIIGKIALAIGKPICRLKYELNYFKGESVEV